MEQISLVQTLSHSLSLCVRVCVYVCACDNV